MNLVKTVFNKVLWFARTSLNDLSVVKPCNVWYHLCNTSPTNMYYVMPFTIYGINFEQEEYVSTVEISELHTMLDTKQYTCNASG